MRAIPEFITEFLVGIDNSGRATSFESFERLQAMFARDPGYSIMEYDVPGGKVYAPFFKEDDGNKYVSSYCWHVPTACEPRRCENGCHTPIRELEDFCSRECWEEWHSRNMPTV